MGIEDDIKQFEINESVVSEGITDEYVWYEGDRLRLDMMTWASRFEKLIKIMEARHKEHTTMLQHLMNENRSLKKELKEKNDQR
jgi:hypothetical protein